MGLVAGRIGAVRGDVVGIEILERGAGRAIDELVIELPDPDHLDQLVAEMSEVDGVDVEEIRLLAGDPNEPELDALAAAARIVETGASDRLGVLVAEGARLFDAQWALAVRAGQSTAEVSHGEPPAVAWLTAFLEGSRHLPGDADGGPDDVAWATMANHDLLVAVGRAHPVIRWRERRTLALLVRLADGLVDQDGALGASHAIDRSTARRHPA